MSKKQNAIFQNNNTCICWSFIEVHLICINRIYGLNLSITPIASIASVFILYISSNSCINKQKDVEKPEYLKYIIFAEIFYVSQS